MERARRGMSLEEVRQLWIPQAEAKTQAIFDAYRERRNSYGGCGHEGLGVYGIYQDRAAREKVRLAVKLLKQAGLEISYTTIRRVTGQSESVIGRHWSPPRPPPPDEDEEQLNIIRFPGQA